MYLSLCVREEKEIKRRGNCKLAEDIRLLVISNDILQSSAEIFELEPWNLKSTGIPLARVDLLNNSP